jgi:hypothetical protein
MQRARLLVGLALVAGAGEPRFNALPGQVVSRSFVEERTGDRVSSHDLLGVVADTFLDKAAKWTAYERFAETRATELSDAIDLAVRYPRAFGALLATGDSAALAASIALTARRTESLASALARWFSTNPKEREEAARAATATDKAAQAALPEPSAMAVQVFADGNIRGVATGGKDKANTATGALGLKLVTRKTIWTASLNIASSADTARTSFGERILLPNSGGQLFSGLFDVRHLISERSGLHSYLSVSRMIWFDSAASRTSSASVLAPSVTWFHDIARGKVGDNAVGLTFEVGFTARFLEGDARQLPDTTRRRLLSTDVATFWGIEMGSQITFGIITAGMEFYLFGARDRKVAGLTSGQVAAAFSIQSAIFSGVLSRQRRKDSRLSLLGAKEPRSGGEGNQDSPDSKLPGRHSGALGRESSQRRVQLRGVRQSQTEGPLQRLPQFGRRPQHPSLRPPVQVMDREVGVPQRGASPRSRTCGNQSCDEMGSRVVRQIPVGDLVVCGKVLFEPEPVQRAPGIPRPPLHEVVIAHGEEPERLMRRDLCYVRLKAHGAGRGQQPKSGIDDVGRLVDIDAEQHVAASGDGTFGRAPQNPGREIAKRFSTRVKLLASDGTLLADLRMCYDILSALIGRSALKTSSRLAGALRSNR